MRRRKLCLCRRAFGPPKKLGPSGQQGDGPISIRPPPLYNGPTLQQAQRSHLEVQQRYIFSVKIFPTLKKEYIDLSSGLKKMYFVKILSRIHTNIYENRHCRGNTSSHALGFGPGQISLSKPDMHFIRFYRRNSKFFLPDPAFMAGS